MYLIRFKGKQAADYCNAKRFTKGVFVNQIFDFSSFFEQISFGLKLKTAAYAHNISYICCNNKTGGISFRVLKYLI